MFDEITPQEWRRVITDCLNQQTDDEERRILTALYEEDGEYMNHLQKRRPR